MYSSAGRRDGVRFVVLSWLYPRSCAEELRSVARRRVGWAAVAHSSRLPTFVCANCVAHRMMEQVATFASDVDHWFTQNYAGHDWAQSGLQGTLPWMQLPLSSVWSPIIGVTAYLLGA